MPAGENRELPYLPHAPTYPMPLPRFVAQLNKRYTNRFIEPIVRRFADFAVVSHIGRSTGRGYQTPVYAFAADGAAVIALTYGPAADWAQNVLAGDGTLTWRGADFAIEHAHVIGRDQAWPHLPRLVRLVLRALRVHDFMLVSPS